MWKQHGSSLNIIFLLFKIRWPLYSKLSSSFCNFIYYDVILNDKEQKEAFQAFYWKSISFFLSSIEIMENKPKMLIPIPSHGPDFCFCRDRIFHHHLLYCWISFPPVFLIVAAETSDAARYSSRLQMYYLKSWALESDHGQTASFHWASVSFVKLG